MSKQNQPWMNSLFRKNNIRQAINNLRDDVKSNVQYNHIPDVDIEPDTVRKIINGCIRNGMVGTEYIEYAMQARINDLSILGDLMSNPNSQMTVVFENRQYYPSSGKRSERILARIEKDKENTVNLTKACKPRNVLVVPKNSDLSSSNYREFITKPYINEVIIGATCHSLNKESQFLTPLRGTNIEAHFFGAGLYDTRVYPRMHRFRHYINEYESFLNCVTGNRHNFAMYFDISKFFESINIDVLSDMIVKNIAYRYNDNLKQKLKKFVASCFRFDVKDNRKDKEDVVTFNNGLTIESHYQHLLSNLYIREIMKEVIEEINDDCHFCKIVNYIDDFYIIANSEEDVRTAFAAIRKNFSGYGLKISDTKVSPVMPYQQMVSEMKSLVRLPATSYFELVNSILEAERSGEEAEDRYTALDQYLAVNQPNLSDVNNVAMYDGIVESDEINKWSKLFREKADLSEYVFKIEDSLFKASRKPEETVELLKTLPAEVTLRILRVIYEKNRSWTHNNAAYNNFMSDACSSVSMFKHSVQNFSSVIKQTKNWKNYNPSSTEKFEKARMYLNDLQYWINNREKFQMSINPQMYFETIQSMLEQVKAGEGNILETLQMFYLTELDGNEEHTIEFINKIQELIMVVLTKYPAKISFLAGVVRRFKFHIMEHNPILIPINNEEHCYNVLTTSTNPEEINESYFAYRFHRFNIKP